MKPLFAPGDIIVQINSGEEFVVDSWNVSYERAKMVYEEYEVFHLITGKKRVIPNDYFSNYAIKVDFAGQTIRLPGGSGGYSGDLKVNKDGTIPLASSDDMMFTEFGECQHEWVTWIGLRGTQTDCTKCKAIKKE